MTERAPFKAPHDDGSLSDLEAARTFDFNVRSSIP
jgi:hypothetical protein